MTGQLVNHIVFWQDYTLRAARGEKPTREDHARNHLMHESDHFGQIMYLRAMQGIEPIE